MKLDKLLTDNARHKLLDLEIPERFVDVFLEIYGGSGIDLHDKVRSFYMPAKYSCLLRWYRVSPKTNYEMCAGYNTLGELIVISGCTKKIGGDCKYRVADFDTHYPAIRIVDKSIWLYLPN